MGIFQHIMANNGKIEQPPKGLTKKERAEWYSETFDDLPDGAFFALAEEQFGLETEDFIDFEEDN